jgi:hypothetical protein
MPRAKAKKSSPLAGEIEPDGELKIYLVPCSCGTSFAVSPTYDRGGTAVSRYLPCPRCGKRHDPKNRLLRLGYQREKYWTVDEC